MQFLRFLRQWFWLGMMIFGLGGWVAKLQADLNDKAEKADYVEIRRDLAALQATVNEISLRQQQFYCENKPAWCR